MTANVGLVLGTTGVALSLSLAITFFGLGRSLDDAPAHADRRPNDVARLRWTGLAGIVGMTLSSLALTPWGLVLGFVTLPLWLWALPDGAELGILDVDTLPLALVAGVAGVAHAPERARRPGGRAPRGCDSPVLAPVPCHTQQLRHDRLVAAPPPRPS